MNVKLLINLFITSILFLTNCSKNIEETPYLTVDKKTVGYKASGGIESVAVKTNIKNWTAIAETNAKSWITLSKNNQGLQIRAAKNDETDAREAKIHIEGNSISEEILVKQMGQNPSIIVSEKSFNVSSSGGEISLKITSNVTYEITIPTNANWLTKKSESVDDNDQFKKTILYNVDWNSKKEERATEIEIKQIGGNLTQKVPILQKGQTKYDGVSKDDFLDDIKIAIKSASASSYQQGSGNIERSFDGDMKTIYHSNWNNYGSNYFPITIEYFFKEQSTIDYFVYYPRQDGSRNGHFKEVEIWVSSKENPKHTKLMDYDFNESGSPTKVSFKAPLQQVTSVRFVIKNGGGDRAGFASCAEMEFYQTNPENTTPLALFTDGTCTELKSGITENDILKISNTLYKNIALYLLRNEYPKEFRIQEYKAWPHPSKIAQTNKTSTYSLLDNPTGIGVEEGEDLIVFVGDLKGQNISLRVQNLDKPGGDGYYNSTTYPLSSGINKINPTQKGLAYIMYHTDNYKNAPKVKIHFATGKVNGYFDLKKHNASDWDRLLNNATNDYFDVLGYKSHLTFPTESYKTYTRNNGVELAKTYDDLVYLEQDFMGLQKYNRVPVNRAYFHVMYHAYMYSTSYRTAYNVSTAHAILNPSLVKRSPWGPAHELGHTHQTRPGFKWVGTTEVTTNVHSLHVQTSWGNASRIENEKLGRFNNRYEKAFYSFFVNKVAHGNEKDVFCKLVPLWQLQLYLAKVKNQKDFYKDFYEQLRVRPNPATNGDCQLNFVKLVCELAQLDMTDFFKKWGFLSPIDEIIDDYGKSPLKITQQQIDALVSEIKSENYTIPSDRIEYICDSNWHIYKNKFSVVKGTATKYGNTITMKNWENVVAYEVWENNQLIFVSNKSKFKLDKQFTNNTSVYAISYNGSKIQVTF